MINQLNKIVEMNIRNNEEIMKIEVWRGPKSKKFDVWRRLGRSWRVFGRLGGLWRDFGRFLWRHWGEDGRNMGLVATLAASCSQDRPC